MLPTSAKMSLRKATRRTLILAYQLWCCNSVLVDSVPVRKWNWISLSFTTWKVISLLLSPTSSGRWPPRKGRWWTVLVTKASILTNECCLLPATPLFTPSWPHGCHLPDRCLPASIQTPYLAGCFLWWWWRAGLCLAGCVHARTRPRGPARAPQSQTCHSFSQWIWPAGLHLGAQHRNNSWTVAEIPRSADQGIARV